MKNMLIIAITILLAVLIGIIMIKGVQIGTLELLSIEQIRAKSYELKQKEEKANDINLIQYKNAIEKLQASKEELETAKTDYLNMASTSTEEEIREASHTQIYSMEFLWGNVGNHATANNINLKMDVTQAEGSEHSVLEFLVTGEYDDIRKFIYSLENDKDLGFRIQNFKMIDFKINENNKDEQYQEKLVQASFEVRNVGIKEENVTTQVEIPSIKNSDKSEENQTEDSEKTNSENKSNDASSNQNTNTNQE